MARHHTLIVGAGIFGVTAALELRRRGHEVTLIDAGPVPHPLAASTDISKVCRMEYGPDEDYMALMEMARDGWLAWNERWTERGIGPLYHETGVLMACREPMAPGGFEYESYNLLIKRGHSPERIDADGLASRFPAWNAENYPDSFFHAKGGYVESGRVVEALAGEAREAGVRVLENNPVDSLLESGSSVKGVVCAGGEIIEAREVVVAAGSWTQKLVPELASVRAVTGHEVFHIKPKNPELFEAERFPVFTADVSRTGYYGFPLHPVQKVVKVANHDLGTPIDPDAPREVTAEHESRLRNFLAGTFPALADAPIVYTRLCLYSDTQDEDFWIARHPDQAGLTVAAGGSGHGLKFAPALGPVIADAAEGNDCPLLKKFRWRMDVKRTVGLEAARCHIRK